MTSPNLMPAAGLPSWFPPLGASGVYLIRRGGAVVYVGESHTGRLRKTLAHHFQSWTGKTAGPTYPRNGVSVSFEVTPPARAVARQNYLILRHSPPDNVQGKPVQTWTQAAAELLDDLNPF